MINYALSAVNGADTRTTPVRRPWILKVRRLSAAQGAEFRRRRSAASLVRIPSLNEDSGKVYRTANRVNAMASFVQPAYTVGAEWFKATNFGKTL